MWLARHWEATAVVLAIYLLSGIPLGLAAAAYMRLRARPALEQKGEFSAAEPAPSPVTGR